MTKPELHPFELELIDRIANEANFFNMSVFTRSGSTFGPATCETAACMAGHIEALRPEMATESFNTFEGLNEHVEVARAIYEKVTGKKCRLDFFAHYHRGQQRREITREEAIEHIQGVSEYWPQLDDGQL